MAADNVASLFRFSPPKSSTILLSGAAGAAAWFPFHGGRSSSRLQCFSWAGSRKVVVSATFASHWWKQQRSGALSLQRSQIPVVIQQRIRRGLRRVLLKKSQELRMRPRSLADTEADSLEDLELDDLNNEELDDLFETYGEVVREESGPSPNSFAEDDDAEGLELALALAEVANDVKANDIRVLFVKPLVYWTCYFVIATGFSRPQVDAIGQRMRTMSEERFKRTPRGDLKPNAWTLLDFGDVVVHIFYPTERSYYNLEEFYGNAASVELPFQPQSQAL